MIDYIGVKCSMHSLKCLEKKYPSNGLFEGEDQDHLWSYTCRSAHNSEH